MCRNAIVRGQYFGAFFSFLFTRKKIILVLSFLFFLWIYNKSMDLTRFLKKKKHLELLTIIVS
jgi:hypothetical protein